MPLYKARFLRPMSFDARDLVLTVLGTAFRGLLLFAAGCTTELPILAGASGGCVGAAVLCLFEKARARRNS